MLFYKLYMYIYIMHTVYAHSVYDVLHVILSFNQYNACAISLLSLFASFLLFLQLAVEGKPELQLQLIISLVSYGDFPLAAKYSKQFQLPPDSLPSSLSVYMNESDSISSGWVYWGCGQKGDGSFSSRKTQ